MKRPIFYFERLKAWDIWTISVYLIVTTIVLFIYEGIISSKNVAQWLFAYTVGTHIFLYIVNYRSLRNFSVYLIWAIVALGHLIAYFHIREDASLKTVNGRSMATGLRNTIILLFTFQVLRIISLNIQHQDLVAPAGSSRTDMFEERKINILDYFLFIIYLAVWVALIII